MEADLSPVATLSTANEEATATSRGKLDSFTDNSVILLGAIHSG